MKNLKFEYCYWKLATWFLSLNHSQCIRLKNKSCAVPGLLPTKIPVKVSESLKESTVEVHRQDRRLIIGNWNYWRLDRYQRIDQDRGALLRHLVVIHLKSFKKKSTKIHIHPYVKLLVTITCLSLVCFVACESLEWSLTRPAAANCSLMVMKTSASNSAK